MKRLAIFLVILAAAAGLGSCSAVRHCKAPEVDFPAAIAGGAAADSLAIADMEWWQFYGDSTLCNIIRHTLANNKDMLAAAARVERMRQLYRIGKADRLPSVSGTVYADHETNDYAGEEPSRDPEFGAKATVSWELDLWGNLRWAKDKSMAEFMGSIENQRALKMSLVAQVAQSYFELVALDNELSIVKKTVDARRESLHLARIRYEGGLTSETAFRQAQVELARTATLVPDLEKKITLKQNEIAFLAGEYPHDIKRTVLPEDVIHAASLPVGLPSSLLERRPDVRQAEQAVIAANAAVGIAYTNMFPKLTLTASHGSENEELSHLFKSPHYLLAGTILQPIFAMGKNRAMLKAKKAACEQAAYAYEKVVLNAFKDAYNAIAEYNKVKEIYETRLRLEQSSKITLDLAQLQYINGVIGYMDLLDAQRGYLDAQIGLSNAVRDKQITMVNLYKALGGGWQ